MHGLLAVPFFTSRARRVGGGGGGGGGSRNSPSDPTNLFKVMMFANIKGGCCLSVCHCVYICV